MTAPFAPSRNVSRLLVLLLWAGVATGLLVVNWHFLVPMNFRDPDDALRLVQVRDLLNGQSWFDLTQHRIHPPVGVPMHWSRVVDLPIALMLAALQPLLGTGLAERVTLAAIPLLELLVLMSICHSIARRLGLSPGIALLSVAMLATSLSVLIQFAPMRIDHHAMQVICGALAVRALVVTDRRDGLMGLIAGLAMAGWLQISVEGLPCTVAMGAIFGIRHVLRTDCWPDIRNYLLALTLASAAMLFGTHYPSDALTPWCDSFSPAYQLPLALACGAVLMAGARLRDDAPNAMVARAMPLMFGGLIGGTTFLLMSRQCLAGPFRTLDPIVYDHWFMAVKEGMPIWTQKPDLQAMIVIPSLLGLLGSLCGLRRARTPERRMAWASLLAMQIVSFAISLDVMRAMSFAHLLALPGNAMLLGRLVTFAQKLRAMPLRIVLSAGTVVLTPFGAAAAMAAALDPANAATTPSTDEADRFRCTTFEHLRGLDALPSALLFTPLDIGAHMLVYTHHSVVATGHHRNAAGMKTAISGLLASPGDARAIVAESGAAYLVYCGGENEVVKYARQEPGSLIALLLAGKHPDWLEPVAMRPGESVKVFRILRSPA